jgi:hypothetical protein
VQLRISEPLKKTTPGQPPAFDFPTAGFSQYLRRQFFTYLAQFSFSVSFDNGEPRRSDVLMTAG